MRNPESPNPIFEVGKYEKDIFEKKLRELAKPWTKPTSDALTHIWYSNYKVEDKEIVIRVPDPEFHFTKENLLGFEELNSSYLITTEPLSTEKNSNAKYLETTMFLDPQTRRMEHHETIIEKDKKGKRVQVKPDQSHFISIEIKNIRDEYRLGVHTVTHDKFEEAMQLLNSIDPKKHKVTKFNKIFRRSTR